MADTVESKAKKLAERIKSVGDAIVRAAEPELPPSRQITGSRKQRQTRLLNGKPDTLDDVLQSGCDTLREIAEEIGELLEAAE